MGMAHRAPPSAYVCRHTISMHATERLQEYGSAVAQSADLETLTMILDEALVQGLQHPDLITYNDLEKDGKQCWLIPFEQSMWADPGLFLLVYDDHSSFKPARKIVKTILTTTAVEKGIQKGKFVKEKDLLPIVTTNAPLSLMPVPMPSQVDLQEQLAISQREVKALQYDLESMTNLYKTQTAAHQMLQQEMYQLQQEWKAQQTKWLTERAGLLGKIEQSEISLSICIDHVLGSIPRK